jgi:hypothetical protein
MHFQALNSKIPNPQRQSRLAVIGNRGTAFLRAGVCASAVRRGFVVNSFFGSSSSYQEMLMDDQSDLYAFNPDVVLLAIDPAQLPPSPKHAARLSSISKQHLGASLIQRTILSLFPAMIDTQASVPRSHASLLITMQRDIRARLDKENICLAFPEERTERGILVSWSEPPIWRRKKRNAHSGSGLLDGNHVGRLLSAVGHFSYKCFMLDITEHSQLPGSHDLDAFVENGYRVNGTSRLDLILLLDEDPLSRKSSLRQNSVFTMPGQREK